MDPRDDRQIDQGVIQDRLEPCLGGAASGPTRHHRQKHLHRDFERDDALVQQWLKKEYLQIKAMAQKEKAENYSGDAHIRSNHHAGQTWGRRGETPVVQTPEPATV